MWRVAGNAYNTPEHRLLMAVLLNGVLDLQRGGDHPSALEAARWIRGEFDGDEPPCSFAAVCEAFDVEASYLARQLLSTGSLAGSVVKVPRRQVRRPFLRRKRGSYAPRRRAVA